MAPKAYLIDSPTERETLLAEHNLKGKSGLAVWQERSYNVAGNKDAGMIYP
jgi:hypothetical protein